MVGGGDLPETFNGEQTTYEYFDVLKVRPALGRAFRQSDDVPNAPRVVILSDRVWRDRFGSDPTVIGRTVKISGENHEIIGVMPRGFTSAFVTDALLWRPIRMNPTNPSRNSAVNHTIGRLTPGMTIEQARARLDALAKRLERDHPETDAQKGINPVLLQDQKNRRHQAGAGAGHRTPGPGTRMAAGREGGRDIPPHGRRAAIPDRRTGGRNPVERAGPRDRRRPGY